MGECRGYDLNARTTKDRILSAVARHIGVVGIYVSLPLDGGPTLRARAKQRISYPYEIRHLDRI
jgi:hypothetical protein